MSTHKKYKGYKIKKILVPLGKKKGTRGVGAIIFISLLFTININEAIKFKRRRKIVIVILF